MTDLRAEVIDILATELGINRTVGDDQTYRLARALDAILDYLEHVPPPIWIEDLDGLIAALKENGG